MKARGFTLIEMVVVLLIVGIVIAMAAGITRVLQSGRQSAATTASMAAVQDALSAYVMTMRRLPCPADGALSSSDASAGRELRTGSTCDNGQARGVVPWVALGLREQDAVDGYGNRLTYRVAVDAVPDNALWMTDCDTAGSAAAVAGNPGTCAACPDQGTGVPGVCTSPANALTGRGLKVQTALGATINDNTALTGAAYVIVSAGANHAGAYGSGGVVQAITGSSAMAAGEVQNEASDAVKAYYVDDPLIDDVVVHPALLLVVNAAHLGPRVHRPFGS